MEPLDELKTSWYKNRSADTASVAYNDDTLRRMFKSRVKKHMNTSFQYFWASLTLQIIVYALLSHVTVRHWGDGQSLIFSIGGIVLFIPFTIVLMRNFKRMATIKLANENPGASSIQHYVARHYELLQRFYTFKKRYEILLIPFASAVGIILTFKLYVAGGVLAYPGAALNIFLITMVSCYVAIRAENKKSFEQPLRQLKEVMDEFRSEE